MSLNHFRMSRSIALLTLVALVGAILLVDVASASTSSAVDSHDDHDDDHSGSTSVHDDDHDDDDDHDHDDDDDHDHDEHDEEEESVVGLKIMSILAITLFAYGVDLLVLAFPQLSRKKNILAVVSSFGGGILAVVAIAHLLAEGGDVIRAEYTTDGHEDDVERFRPAEMVALLGYFIMLFLQRGIFNMEKESGEVDAGESKTEVVKIKETSDPTTHAVVPIVEKKKTEKVSNNSGPLVKLFVMFLSFFVHGISEGLALGLQTTKSGVLVIFVAIILHHWAVDLIFTFATGQVWKEEAPPASPVSGEDKNATVERRYRETYFSTPARVAISFFCSSNVGIGIVIGWGLQSAIPTVASAYIVSFSAGTFIYFAFSDIVPAEMAEGTGRKLPQLLAFFIGMGVIYATLAAIYSPEAHNH